MQGIKSASSTRSSGRIARAKLWKASELTGRALLLLRMHVGSLAGFERKPQRWMDHQFSIICVRLFCGGAVGSRERAGCFACLSILILHYFSRAWSCFTKNTKNSGDIFTPTPPQLQAAAAPTDEYTFWGLLCSTAGNTRKTSPTGRSLRSQQHTREDASQCTASARKGGPVPESELIRLWAGSNASLKNARAPKENSANLVCSAWGGRTFAHKYSTAGVRRRSPPSEVVPAAQPAGIQ